MRGNLAALLAFLLLLSRPVLAADQASNAPTLNANGWTLILVPHDQTAAGTGNLSVAGLNHSLRFGQLAAAFTAGLQPQVRGILDFQDQDASGPPDISALQSIEPVAVLGGLAVNVVSVAPGSGTGYGTALYWAQDLLANQAPGIYFISASLPTVRLLIKHLTKSDAPLGGDGDYAVVSGVTADQLSAQVFHDGIVTDSRFPTVPVPRSPTCSVPHVVITARAPAGLATYKSRTVLFVRHVEAHPSANFENGNYVCQGQWRALGATDILGRLLGRRPDAIVSSNTSGLISCNGTCSYIRPLLTVTPFAIRNGLPVTLAPFDWTDATDLAYWLFDKASLYAADLRGADKDPSLILVGWEHAHIVAAVKALFARVYQDPSAAAKLPAWSYTDYDTAWQLSTDKDGNLTFSNTCEGIPTAALPNVCPAFFP